MSMLLDDLHAGSPDGSAIVILPGLGANMAVWDYFIDAAVAKDPEISLLMAAAASTGPGTSPALLDIAAYGEEIARDLKSYNFESILLIGHSVGAFIALEVARNPFSNLVGLLLPNGGLLPVAEILDRPICNGIRNRALMIGVFLLFANNLFPLPLFVKRAVASSDRLSDWLLKGSIGPDVRHNRDRRTTLLATPGHPEVARGLWVNRHYLRRLASTASQVELPVRFLAGSADPFASCTASNQMASMFQKADMRCMERIGHSMPLECPNELLDEALNMLSPNSSRG